MYFFGIVPGAQNEASYRAMFTGDKPAQVSMFALNRVFRLGAGGLLVSYGISTGSLLVAGIGGIVAFLVQRQTSSQDSGITGL